MAYVPVQIGITAGGEAAGSYNRQIELTSKQLTAFMDAAADMTVPFTAVAGDMRREVEEAFATEGSSGASGKWVALSPQYEAWKAEKGPGLPILIGLRPTSWVGHRTNPPGQQRNTHQTYATSGETMRSLLSPLEDMLTWQISAQRMRYTPTSRIAGYLETGTEKMPARPPVDLSIGFLHTIDRQFVRWLAALQKKNAL